MFLSKQIKETIVLSVPLIISQVGHVVTGLVDNIFLGQIGKTEQAAGFLANNIFVLVLVFSIGMSYALTPLTTDAAIEKNEFQKASLLKHSFILNLILSFVLFFGLFITSPLLAQINQPTDVADLAIPFFQVLAFSIIPCSFFFTGKQFTEGLNNTLIAMIISVTGNLLNIILNYLLIYGKAGFPEMGYMGSCWATCIARVFMGYAFWLLIFKGKEFKSTAKLLKNIQFDKAVFIRLLSLGIGSALQFTFEVGAFVCCALMVGKFGKEQIDAHGIAMGIASFTYMFSSGISGAATILIGKYQALNEKHLLKKSILSSMLCSIVITVFFALIFIYLNQLLTSFFTVDVKILTLASHLLIIGGFFQLFDGIQVTALGILRGLQDVKIPTIITLFAYWIICLPLAYYVGFILKYESIGIWYAILISLFLVSVALLLRIRYLIELK